MADDPLAVDLVALEQQATWCLGGAGARPGTCNDVAGGRIWWCVGLDQRERLVAGEDQLDGSYHDAAKRIATDLSQAGPRRRLAGEAAEGGRVEA